MMFQLAVKSLLNRAALLWLVIASIALAVGLLVAVDRIRDGAKESFSGTISGVDIIVGPRSGAVQLMLSSVFRIGEVPNAMTWESFETISARPEVSRALPLLLGDSHAGFRVVGTIEDYFHHFRYRDDNTLSFSEGQAFSADNHVVLGARVAAELGYRLGDNLVLNHGLGHLALAEHDEAPFTVVGILAPTGTPVDQALYTSLEGIEALHHQEGGHDHHEPSYVSAALISLTSPLSTFTYQRWVNDYPDEPLSAILPTVALLELWSILEVGEQALRIVTLLMLASSLIGLMVTLLAVAASRRREIAILRVQGARPWHVISLIVAESALLGFLGAAIGALFGLGGLSLVGPWFEARFGIEPKFSGLALADFGLVLTVTICAAIAGFIPAISAYTKSVSDGIAVKL